MQSKQIIDVKQALGLCLAESLISIYMRHTSLKRLVDLSAMPCQTSTIINGHCIGLSLLRIIKL